MKDISYYIGVAVGFLIVVGFGLLVRFVFKTKHVKPEFDERQIIARGKAYKAGFFTLLIYGAICTVLQALELNWMSGLLREVLGIVLGAGVFAVVAILNDAYLGFNENNRYSIIILLIVGLLNFACGIMGIITDGLSSNSGTRTYIVNLMVSLLFFVLLGTYWLHKKKSSVTEEVEEE